MRLKRRIASVLVPALSLALAAPVPALEREGAPAPAGSARIVHALNRLGYGPRPGDVEKVEAMGLEKWIDEQLHPERIPDPEPEKRLADLGTLHMSPKDLVAKYELPRDLKQEMQKKRAAMDGASEQEMNRARREFMQEHGLKMDGGPQRVVTELQTGKLLRAVYSERQLDEVMVDFWLNHFNVFAQKGPEKYLIAQYEKDVIRPHAWGKFEDLLRATAESPAMLFYLDNWLSTAPVPEGDMAPPRGTAAGGRGLRGKGKGRLSEADAAMTDEQMQQRAQIQKGRARGLNENYAREIMELHTLGVDGGYTQKDVTELARCLTGWTLLNPRGYAANPEEMRKRAAERGVPRERAERMIARAAELQNGEPRFVFDERRHDKGEKVVLGKTFQENGKKEGIDALHMLATHPSTAHFISYKLVRRFVSDAPPPALVDRATAVFKKTDGDIREVVKTIVTSPEFASEEARAAKVKTPLEFVVSAVRASGAEVVDGRALNRYLERMGMPLYMQQPPTGYKDTADAWVSTGGLLTRLNFALDLSGGRIPGVRTDPKILAPHAADTASYMEDAAAVLLPNGLTDSTRDIVNREASGLDVARVAGLLLGSPEFQKR
jgi:uncharacterized protein (DUF1800 family)